MAKVKKYTTCNEVTRQHILKQLDTSEVYEVTLKKISPDKVRTTLQNSAIHKDIANVTDILNAHGVTLNTVYEILKKDAPVTFDAVKGLWHVVCESFGLPPSTKKLSTSDVSKVREAIEVAFAVRKGIDIGDFPSIERMRKDSLIENH